MIVSESATFVSYKVPSHSLRQMLYSVTHASRSRMVCARLTH